MKKPEQVEAPSPAFGEAFWELIEEFQETDSRVEEGTIMSSACARVNGEFLAMTPQTWPGLVVKLPRQRVADLIGSGQGESFAPAGRVFKEWVLIPVLDLPLWRQLLAEGIEFVG